MQRWYSRLAAHILSNRPGPGEALRSPSAEGMGVAADRADGILTRWWERWVHESSPRLIGEEKTQDVLVIGFCAAFSLIGWMMLMQGVEQLTTAREIERWPTTTGVIVSVEVQEAGGGEGTRWRPHIAYTYDVDGRVITGTQLTVGKAPAIKDEEEARDYVRRYLPQTRVRVYYNPDEITESVLEPSTPRSAHLNLTLGIALACLGPVLFLMISSPVTRYGNAQPSPPRGLTPPSQQ